MTSEDFRELLKKSRFTQKSFAELTGYSANHMNRIATGKDEIPRALAVLISIFATLEDLKGY